MTALVLVVLAGLGPCPEAAVCTVKLRAPPATHAPLRVALGRLGLKEDEPRAPAKLEPKVLSGDTAFAIEVDDGPGHLPLVRVLSLHRPPSTYGMATVKTTGYITADQRRRAFEVGYQNAIEEALADLSAELAVAAGVGRRTLRLTVGVNGLESLARKYAIETYLPCLKGQFDQLGAVTEPREVAGYLEDVVEYAPAKDEPRDYLPWQVNRLRALTHGAKAACPPPAKHVAKLTADALNRGVLIELK